MSISEARKKGEKKGRREEKRRKKKKKKKKGIKKNINNAFPRQLRKHQLMAGSGRSCQGSPEKVRMEGMDY